MKKLNCPMCDTHKADPSNPHQWCDACESEFTQTMTGVAHQCKECVTPITCMMLKRCGMSAPIAKKLYEIKRQD